MHAPHPGCPGCRLGSVRSHAGDAVLHDMTKIVQADVMMSSAIRAPLAKRARRKEAETIWL